MSGLKVICVITHERRDELQRSHGEKPKPLHCAPSSLPFVSQLHSHRHALRNSIQVHRGKRLHRINARNIRYKQPAGC